MMCPTIKTDRLIIRRYKESDIDMQYEFLQDERLHQYISPPNLSREEELEVIKKWIADSDTSSYERWVIALRSTDKPIGNISVNAIDKKNNYCNVGYVILFDYQGMGYATEALTAVSDYLLKDRKYYLVECSCHELNVASSRVMLKAGFVKDGYIQSRRKNPDGSYSAVEYYSKKTNFDFE